LAAADAWYLYLEGPTVHLNVTGVLLLDPSTAPNGFSFKKFRTYVGGRLDRMPTLRRRLVEVPLAIDHPCWIDDPDFDLDRHVHHHTLSHDDGSSETLESFVSRFSSTPLPRDRPLWDMVMVDGLDDGRVALVVRMHHCIVDGVSGMDVMAHLLDLAPTGERRRARPQPAGGSVPRPVGVATSAAWGRMTNPMRPVRAFAGATCSLTRMVRTTALRRLGGARAVAHPINAPRTRFNGSITEAREVAFDRVPLDDLKVIGRAFGVTVNDVVLAGCTHGLRCYLAGFDEIPDRPLVCSVPVSIHAHGSAGSANQVSNMFVNLPVEVPDPVERLRLIHEGALGAKEIQGSVGTDLISDVIELIPVSIFQMMMRLYSQTGLADRWAPVHNLIVSNVVGSPLPLYMAGAQVVAMYPFGPLIEGTGLNITVLSNNGEMNVGLIGCPALVPGLPGLLDAILAGFDVLVEAARRVG
jgi:WS/DGAT/MGAT family acyltransferase